MRMQENAGGKREGKGGEQVRPTAARAPVGRLRRGLPAKCRQL